MSESDVSQLAKEALTKSAFPASQAADFRVFFEDDVHRAISAHASEDTSVEICGVIVGQWHQDDDGPFARITSFIRCDEAASKDTEVTFTHQSWAQINEVMDSKYADSRIIGWYHSHPDFGIFLSDRDMFIQEHFFSGPGQVAYVVDPVRKLEGVFEWRNGKAELMQQYWVGNRVVSVEASSSVRVARSIQTTHPELTPPADQLPRRDEGRGTSMALLLLSGLCLFLLGMLLGEWRRSSHERLLVEGAIAHYGLWNVMQLGRSEQLEAVQKKVSASFDELTVLSEQQTAKLEGEERTAVRQQFRSIRKTLAQTRSDLNRMASLYSVPPEQRQLMAQVVASHLAALSGFDARKTLPVPVPISSMPAPPTGSSTPASPKQSDESVQKPAASESVDTGDPLPSAKP